MRKKVKLEEDEQNPEIISHAFIDYRTIQDFPIRGRACYLHLCKRKWLDKSTGEIFSYEWDLSEHEKTKLNAEFVAFLKDGDRKYPYQYFYFSVSVSAILPCQQKKNG